MTAVTGISFYKVFVFASFCLVALNYTRLKGTSSKTLLSYLVMLTVFLLFASLSILWAPDRSLSYSKINNIFIALLVAHILYSTNAFAAQRFRTLTIGWIVAVATTVAFAVVELAAGRNFFGSARFEDRETYGHIVMSTFHNPNNFSIFLALVMPILAAHLDEEPQLEETGAGTALVGKLRPAEAPSRGPDSLAVAPWERADRVFFAGPRAFACPQLCRAQPGSAAS